MELEKLYMLSNKHHLYNKKTIDLIAYNRWNREKTVRRWTFKAKQSIWSYEMFFFYWYKCTCKSFNV